LDEAFAVFVALRRLFRFFFAGAFGNVAMNGALTPPGEAAPAM
jgi:hypothetical protein